MLPDAPTVDETAYLHEIYGAAQMGLPVAVTDLAGKLVGVVPPEAIFAQLAADEDAEAPEGVPDAGTEAVRAVADPA